MLNIYVIEDSDVDYHLIVREVRRHFEAVTFTWLTSAAEFRQRVHEDQIHLIISDYNVPGFGAMAALEYLRGEKLDIPLIVISGAIGEERAVEMMKAGAFDFLNKSNLERLVPTIRQCLIEAEQMRLAKERVRFAEQATSIREQGLAIVSHDIKNPLSAIQILCESTIEKLKLPYAGERDSQISDNLNLISKSVYRIKTLIADYLDQVRIDAGSFHVERNLSRIDLLMQELDDLFRPIAGKKKIHWKISYPKEDVYAPFDFQRILQALMNLIGNSIKFTPEGGSIEVSAELGSQQFSVKVKDSGIGIKKEDIPHIFEKFWQTASAIPGQGSGLGLHIAAGIIQAHSGQISVKSEPGHGSEFLVTLPKVTSADFRIKEPKKIRNGKLILLIEDDEDLREVVEELLCGEGFRVASVNNGREGFEMLRDEKVTPDLLLMDFHLPEMTGDQILRGLVKARNSDHFSFPIVMATAESSLPPELFEIKQLNLLKKPYPLVDLIKMINLVRGVKPTGAPASVTEY